MLLVFYHHHHHHHHESVQAHPKRSRSWDGGSIKETNLYVVVLWRETFFIVCLCVGVLWGYFMMSLSSRCLSTLPLFYSHSATCSAWYTSCLCVGLCGWGKRKSPSILCRVTREIKPPHSKMIHFDSPPHTLGRLSRVRARWSNRWHKMRSKMDPIWKRIYVASLTLLSCEGKLFPGSFLSCGKNFSLPFVNPIFVSDPI